MVEENVMITNAIGLHARPAALLVKTAGGFACEIVLVKDNKTFNAKSILSVMSAGIKQHDTVTIRATGEGEEAAVAAVALLIKDGFGEK